jgi:hypothetical protein
LTIDKNAAKQNYVTGSANNSQKLVTNYVKKTGKLDAAKSDSAEALWAAKIQQAIANKSRQKGLAGTTENAMNSAMTARGGTNYASGTAANADKQATNVAPYLDALDSLEGKYPARVADGMQNLTNRAGLVVKTLQALKKSIG